MRRLYAKNEDAFDRAIRRHIDPALPTLQRLTFPLFTQASLRGLVRDVQAELSSHVMERRRAAAAEARLRMANMPPNIANYIHRLARRTR